MSDYPPAPPYDAGYGGQPQTNNPPYVQPTYPNQYMQDDSHAAQTHMVSNYDTSMSAYGYNNSIPGFSAGSIAPAAPPLPIYQGWNQDAIPLPPYSTPHNNMQYTGYTGTSYQPQQAYTAPQQQNYHQNSLHVPPYDEGELSEGEFDAYAGHNTGGGAVSTDYGSNYYHGNDGTGYMNAAHRAVYPNGRDYGSQRYSPGSGYNNYQESALVSRQQSDSYSPYNAHAPSHATGQSVNNTPQDRQSASWKQSDNATIAAENTALPNGSITHMKEKTAEHAEIQAAPTVKPKVQHDPIIQARHEATLIEPSVQHNSPPKGQIHEDVEPITSPPATQRHPAIQTGFPKSVAEARKKAELAILNLWPYEVRFPNYVEEGLDEKIVGRLFDELGFSRASTKSTAPAQSSQSLKLDKSPNLGSSNLGNGVEARGILAEKNGNSLALDPSAALSASPSTAAMNAPQLRTNEPTDKEKNLKMKMEMLRKSREERAQKAAAKSNTASSALSAVAATMPSPSSQPELQAPLTTAKVAHSPKTSPLPPIHQPATIQQTSPLSIPQPVPQPQPPSIPGLFLASTSSPVPTTTSHGTIFGTSQSNQRKRPVAADFDTTTSVMPFKRPFGQSRSESLVIDVSEEESDSEDEDVAMDLESQADQDSPVQSARMISDQRTATIHNLPPLTNFPTRKAFNSPPDSSAANTPPIHSGLKATLGHPQVLQQKETEIELLKKKIAEAEAAKAAKRRAQHTSSGAATPQPQATNGTSGFSNHNNDIASSVEVSIQMQQLIGVADDKVSSDQKKLAEAQAAEQEKAAELKRNEAESRRLRREKIATDLPRVDAEVEQNQLKLLQLREEIAKIEAAVQKSIEDKRIMAEEMERLGQEAEEQLQEQKNKLKHLTSPETTNTSNSPRPVSLPTTRTEIDQFALPLIPISNPDTTSTNLTQPTGNLSQEQTVQPASESVLATNNLPHRSASNETPVKTNSLITSDQALEAVSQEQVRAQADSYEQEVKEINIQALYASDPAQLTPEPSFSPKVIIEDNSKTPAFQAIAGEDTARLPKTELKSVMENEDDGYEPPEATHPTDIPSQIDSPPFSPAPPESISGFEQFDFGTRALGHSVEEGGAEEVHTNGSVHQLIQSSTENSNQIQFFTPYESPLKLFRAFRFHPDFKREVSGGLKSMTYSHKIDPNTEFCRYELAGGVCNDKSCEFQHFRDIALPGASVEAKDTILSALGSPEEFPHDQQQRFREGLRQVLTDLRARKVRDFNTIAAELVAHRSTFLGDPSKVLMLEGTTI